MSVEDLWKLKQSRILKSHRVTPATTALLVIDMQSYFLEKSSPAFISGGVAILPGLKRLVASFRKAGRPVIYTRHVHHPDPHRLGYQ